MRLHRTQSTSSPRANAADALHHTAVTTETRTETLRRLGAHRTQRTGLGRLRPNRHGGTSGPDGAGKRSAATGSRNRRSHATAVGSRMPLDYGRRDTVDVTMRGHATTGLRAPWLKAASNQTSTTSRGHRTLTETAAALRQDARLRGPPAGHRAVPPLEHRRRSTRAGRAKRSGDGWMRAALTGLSRSRTSVTGRECETPRKVGDCPDCPGRDVASRRRRRPGLVRDVGEGFRSDRRPPAPR